MTQLTLAVDQELLEKVGNVLIDACGKPLSAAEVRLALVPKGAGPEVDPQYTDVLWTCRVLEYRGGLTVGLSKKAAGYLPVFAIEPPATAGAV